MVFSSQGALVSVSGGDYRRNAASPASGSLRFASLAPGEYYVKPNMKEFRFHPAHHILLVEEGKTHPLTLRWASRRRIKSNVISMPSPHYQRSPADSYELDAHRTFLVWCDVTRIVVCRGTRVAWSCRGALVSLGAAGWARAALQAAPRAPPAPPASPAPSAPACVPEDALTDAQGLFRWVPTYPLPPTPHFQLSIYPSRF